MEGRTIDDLSDLAYLLGIPPRDLRTAIGVPWRRALPARYDHDFGPLFVGREGLSVALLCLGSDAELIGVGGTRTRTATRVVVGMSRGAWRSDGQLGWELDGTKRSLVRGVGVDPKAFLTALRAAVCSSAREKRPEMITCASCDELVGPESRRGASCLRCLDPETAFGADVRYLVTT